MKYIYQNKIFIRIILFQILFLVSCKNTEEKISEMPVEPIHIEAFEDEFFAVDSLHFRYYDSIFSKKYFPFYQYYISDIIYYRQELDSSKQLILKFINDKDIRYVYQETKKVFKPEFRKQLEDEIKQLHQHIQFYFPDKKLPKRYLTFISGFNFQIVYPENSDIIGISTDMYLGSQHQVYVWLQWPRYRVNQLNKEFIPVDIAKAWLFSIYPYGKYNNLLEHMMYYGKVMYALKKLLPSTHDSLIFSYSAKQLEYCKKFEKNLWGYFTEENRLYDNSPKSITAYLNDGPFTAAISKECPPRIGMYIAYKIVESYMKRNEISLNELMQENNAQKILQQSKYRP